jgi:hypothetical protein
MITDGSTAQGKPCGVFYREGHLADSEKLDREVLEIWSKTLGPEHPNTLSLKANIADTLLKEGHFREAERLQRETLATQIRLRGPEDLPSLVSQSDLAETLIREGRYAEAEETARAAFQVQLRKLGPLHPDTVATMRNLGRGLPTPIAMRRQADCFATRSTSKSIPRGKGLRSRFGIPSPPSRWPLTVPTMLSNIYRRPSIAGIKTQMA